MTGQAISHYRILEKLGQGGMGAVYKAEDLKLKRIVALKFISPESREDPDFSTRFHQEARAAAALSHANVCAVYEIDEGLGFFAMEYIEGETVQASVRKRPLPLPEALDIAMQAARGLQAAHERGIVHRDIKSTNLMITPRGGVKITDFGLARLAGRTRITRTGAAAGTPAYMSPEQASGKALDRRTDLWSLGVVLYEMVAGQLPFHGDSEAAVAHSILHEDPEPLTALRAGLPMELDRVIGKALAKDPGERYQHAEDLLVDLKTLRARLQSESKSVRRADAPGKARAILSATAGLLLGGAGYQLWHWQQARMAPRPQVVRFTIDLPPDRPITPGLNPSVMLSPDGKLLAYEFKVGATSARLAARGTFIRGLDEIEPKPLAHAPGLRARAFSPDSRSLILVNAGDMSLRKAAVNGGAPVLLCRFDMHFRGQWAPDNYYYWTDGYFGPVIRTPVNGGSEEAVTALDLDRGERSHRHVQVLPGGKAIIFAAAAAGMNSYDDARIDLQILGTKKRKTLVQGGFSPMYSPSGHIVYARNGDLWAVPFDSRRMEVTGLPFKAVSGVFMSTNSSGAHFDVSASGTLAYGAGKAEGENRTLVWVDRQGNATPLPLPPRPYLFPRISPGGTSVAYEVEGVNHDLFLYDPSRDVVTKITTDGVSHAPVWTPDGGHIAFRSWKAGTMTMWWMPADRSAPEERLTTVGSRQNLVSFSPDGRYAAFDQMETDGSRTNIYMLPMTGQRAPRPFLRTRFTEGSARFSPDGRWVAYCTDESGSNEVFVQPWPGPGPRIQISSGGGTDPIFRRDGKELFYRNGSKMMVVSIEAGATFKASRPRLLWEGTYSHGMSSSCGAPGTTESSYDVSADGRRFLMVKDQDKDASSRRIVVVINFSEELKRLEAASSAP